MTLCSSVAFHINLKRQREEPSSHFVGFITPIVAAAALLQIEVGSGTGTDAVLVTGTEELAWTGLSVTWCRLQWSQLLCSCWFDTHIMLMHRGFDGFKGSYKIHVLFRNWMLILQINIVKSSLKDVNECQTEIMECIICL